MNFYKTQKLLFFISFIFLPGLSFSNICPEWVEGNQSSKLNLIGEKWVQRKSLNAKRRSGLKC